MSFSFSSSSSGSSAAEPTREGPSRRTRVLLITLAVLAGLLLLLALFSGFYTDLLWFQSLKASSVFTTQLATQLGLFAVFTIIMAAGLGVSMWIAYRLRPMFPARTAEQLSLERYRESLEPMRKPLAFAIPAVIGVLAGISATAGWKQWLMWRNQESFGKSDPQFGTDIGFYVFTYPWLRFVLGFAFALVIFSFLAAIVVHYLYGGIRLLPAGDRFSEVAQSQLSVLLGVFCLLKAFAYWLDRYGLALKSDSITQGFTGLKFRDVHALLPAKSILFWIALICALLFFINAFRRSWPVAGAGLGLLVVSALLIGGIYPAIVQQFQVRPSELTKEAPSIQNNIQATREAYGIDNISTLDYDAKAAPNKQVLATQTGTTEAIRIVDPAVVPPAFKALQQYRSFYSFPDALNVDRYQLGEKEQGAVVAVREINLGGLQDSQKNWANEHLVYTHGYGFVAAYDNAKQSDGNPVFFESNIPPTGELKLDQPRIYFGENSPTYSIVGGPAGSDPRELDYPDDTDASGQRNNTYEGSGGVPVGSGVNRLMFAIKFQEPNILLSGLINDQSRIMWDRDPRDLVSKVAPWLKLDEDPYPVVVDGRVKWIVDAYTTTNDYPFATRTTLAESAAATATDRIPIDASLIPGREELNYIRNSVKAVVDAYDGTVDLYAWDESEPILATWMKTFPGIIRPRAQMPESVSAHIRYPEDIFSLQRYMYARYHVTDPSAFYSGQDFWVIPTDPTKKTSNDYQPPYYLSLQMPGDAVPRFSLTTTYAPAKRQTLAAFMRVDCTPGENYGKFQALQLPRNTAIPGPVQVQNSFESNTEISGQLALWRKGGSEVDLGNLLSLPVGDGILYVEPVYLRAAQDGYPLLQQIMAGFGAKVVMKPTLKEALDAVLGEVKPDKNGNGDGKKSPEQSALAALNAALAEAQTAYDEGQQALKNGDFAAYGEAQKKLSEALAKAEEASKKLNRESPPAPAPAPTPSPSPTTAAPAPV